MSCARERDFLFPAENIFDAKSNSAKIPDLGDLLLLLSQKCDARKLEDSRVDGISNRKLRLQDPFLPSARAVDIRDSRFMRNGLKSMNIYNCREEDRGRNL